MVGRLNGAGRRIVAFPVAAIAARYNFMMMMILIMIIMMMMMMMMTAITIMTTI